jgi:hypothetical protein
MDEEATDICRTFIDLTRQMLGRRMGIILRLTLNIL